MSAGTPPPGWLGVSHLELARCGSTSDEAARLARAGAPHGAIVTAIAQDSGRGRHGRAWASPPGAGLYLSAVLRPSLALPAVPPLTLAIGIAVCDAARAHGAAATLKWPNDVVVVDDAGGGPPRKLAGVLVETHSQGGRLDAVIAGIGLNLLPVADALPPELAARSTSLADATAVPVDRAAVLATLLAELERWIDRYVAGGLPAIADPWHARMATGLRGRVVVDGAPLEGALVGLDGDGSLLLADDRGGRHRVRAGEVELVAMAPPTDPR